MPRVADAYRRQGQKIVLRSVVSYTPEMLVAAGISAAIAPGESLVNPPLFAAPKVNPATLAGASTVVITAERFQGVVAAGDRLRVVGMTEWQTVTGVAVSNGPRTDALTLVAPGITVTLSAVFSGTPPAGSTLVAVEFAWANDKTCYARPTSFSFQAVDGANILQGDLRIGIPSHGLPRAPKIGDLVLIDGTPEARILSSMPVYLPGGAVALYNLQGRR